MAIVFGLFAGISVEVFCVQWYLYLFISRVTIFFVKGVGDMHFLILFILQCMRGNTTGMVCQDMIV